MQRAEHGEQVDWSIITLASMIGQVGLAGGGFGFSMHYEGGGDEKKRKRTVGGLSQGKGGAVSGTWQSTGDERHHTKPLAAPFAPH